MSAALSPLIVLPLTAYATMYPLWDRPTFLSGVEGVLLDLLILDCWTYWTHRAYHRIGPMWRLHVVHHLDGHLDTTSAVRFHFLEIALSAALRMIPIILLGVPMMSVIIFEVVLLMATLFHHSNLKLPLRLERALSFVIVTPSIHWVHHHAVQADTDSNYSTVLSIWDWLFGTRSATNRHPDMKIGVEGLEVKSFFRLFFLSTGGKS